MGWRWWTTKKEKKEDCEYMVTFGGSEFDGKGVDGNRGMWVGEALNIDLCIL